MGIVAIVTKVCSVGHTNPYCMVGNFHGFKFCGFRVFLSMKNTIFIQIKAGHI